MVPIPLPEGSRVGTDSQMSSREELVTRLGSYLSQSATCSSHAAAYTATLATLEAQLSSKRRSLTQAERRLNAHDSRQGLVGRLRQEIGELDAKVRSVSASMDEDLRAASRYMNYANATRKEIDSASSRTITRDR